MPTACILYGFGEGPRIGWRLARAVEAKGYRIINDPGQADVIIAHSAGCLLLPAKVRAKQIIQIGPYWPEQPWIVAACRKFMDDMQLHHQGKELSFWLRKSLWNLVYFCKMPTNLHFLRGIKNGRQWRHGSITTVVRPRFDNFCAPVFQSHFKDQPTFISFPGHHDDCWRNPQPYLSLIKS
jgi:hypothetical protein